MSFHFPTKDEIFNLIMGSTHQNQHALTLDKHENVIFLGAKPYSDAIRYIAHFDAAIVPHKDTELTRVMDPLKLYVYLSVGVPVVSTEVAFNKALADRIHFGTDAKQFADHIDSIMQAKQKGEIRSSALEADECWPARVNTLLDLVDAQLHFPT